MMYRRLSLFLLLFASVAASCQSVTGTLLGTVADASGVVPGVKVTATSQGTNVTLSTVTNQVGDYEFDNLSAGLYRIHVERQGFRSVDVKNVQLLLNQTTRNNISLVPGEVQQSIEVTASAPVIQSETSSIATIIDTNSIQKLPVNGRTMDTFIATVPGNTGEASGSNPKIAGSEHWGGTSFTVDGVGYNDLGNGGGAYSYQTSLTTQPSLDTIQEVKVESNNAKAEFSSTVAISMITKGGTNRFHGSIFAFNRNTAFAANDYFANANHLARTPYNRNEFGGSVGGPIYKNHTFFFFSYEGWRQRTSRTGTFSVPTADQRAGCFNTKIKDPDNGGTPFPSSPTCPTGYQIPTSRLDPRTLAVLKFVPLPTKAGNTSNLVQTLPTRINVNRYSGRLDQNFNANNRLTFIVNYSKGGNPYSVNLNSPVQYNNYSNAGYTTKSGSATYTRILTPSMSNEIRASYFAHVSTRQGQNLDFDPSTLFPGLYPHAVGGLPTFSISGLTAIADRGGANPQPQIVEQIGDTFSWQKGSHIFKAGADLAYNRVSTNPSVSPSTLGFFYFGAFRYTGSPLGNAMLGYPNDAVRSTQTPSNEIGINRYGFYAQDDWRIFPRLTLNLGLRYELQTEPTERYGGWTNFDFAKGLNVVRSVNGKLPGSTNQTLLNLYPYETSEDAGWGSNVLLPDHRDFAPRIGFAFRPFSDDRMVLRGGYGIFYNMPPVYQGIYQLGISNPPFRLVQEYDSAPASPTVTLANPFSVTPFVTANPSLYAVDRQIRNTSSQQWNLTVENRLPGDIGLRMTYLGNKVAHAVFVNYNMNLPKVQQSGAALQPLRPYQPYGDILAMRFNGASFTNQLQVEGTKRYGNGVFFESSLNWTKGIDNVNEVGSPQDPYNPAGDRGNADGVRRITFYASGGYDLPFGPGRRYLQYGGVRGKLLEGWNVAAIAQIMSGAPFTVTFDNAGDAWYANRADVVPGVAPYATDKNIAHWLNKDATGLPLGFVKPQPNTFGNSQRNTLFGPGVKTVDMNLSKNTTIAEGVRLELRVDAFNLTNTANFNNPSSDITVPSTYGTITSTNPVVISRKLQFGAKVTF
jgi:hypothetical protein